jgi:hypothetical protein
MLLRKLAAKAKYSRTFYSFLIVSLIAASLPYTVYSAYDRPVAWSDMSALDLRAALRSQYASKGNLYDPVISESAIDLVLQDADHRISRDFQVPPQIKADVGFWLRIYTAYTTQHVVLFDGKDMGVIYEVIDLRQLADTARNPVVYEIVSKNRIQKALDAYRRAFASLARNPHPKRPNREEGIILSKMKYLPHRHSFRDLGASFKTMRGQRDNLIKGLLAAEAFFPKMEMIFTRMNVPPELTRLSLVESSFNLKATSKVGASGVWQFMPNIGKKFLVMNDQISVDERRSPLKSTFAAAKMLKWNRNYLGSWILAVISYNHGLKNLPRLKGPHEFSRFANLFDGCRKTPLLGFASRSYYSEFLATLYAESYRNLFFGEIPSSSIRPITLRQLPRNETALNYAMEKGISFQEFSLLNADVQDIHKPLPRGFWIAVPGEADDIDDFVRVAQGLKRKQPSSPHRTLVARAVHVSHKTVHPVFRGRSHASVAHAVYPAKASSSAKPVKFVKSLKKG